MTGVVVAIVVVVVVALIVFASAFHIVQQYEKGVVFRFGRVTGEKGPGLVAIVPFVNVLRKVSFRIVTMPIQSQGIITRDNVSVDVSAVSYYRVVDATKSVIAIENIEAAINQIAQTTLRKVVGQHTLDEMLAETDRINVDIKEILDIQTADWGVLVTLVELKDIQLPDTMKRAMARQAEAEREKRAKIIAAEGESLAATALGEASDIMMVHPLALQLRNLQTLIEIGVDKNTTVVFPGPLMSTIQEIGAFLSFVGLVIQLQIPDLLNHAIDNSIQAHTVPLSHYVWWVLGLGLVGGVTGYIARLYLFETAYDIEYDLRNIIYEHLTRMSFAFYDRVQS